ncbi:hypothetical protein P691DRAFT_764633 [Macrolepiota fuliginosa MF-IS2]|uniref:Uncharacterized protein n=1 Tax=Macrolepiota fuliginosa MF-IS2 TaxID=1400762 RepID=A0A9P5X576_9AGAR|nr:hypothetical protein P691DRAFT_764633 [Macrolepiota fuliginosa MF-IS2]
MSPSNTHAIIQHSTTVCSRVAAHSTGLFALDIVLIPLRHPSTSPAGIKSDDGQVHIRANVAVAAGGEGESAISDSQQESADGFPSDFASNCVPALSALNLQSYARSSASWCITVPGLSKAQVTVELGQSFTICSRRQAQGGPISPG